MGTQPHSWSHGSLGPVIGNEVIGNGNYAAPPNPRPENFSIVRTAKVGTYVCALVHYPDATNFEGKKIIVFEDTTESTVTEASEIDPHFSEDSPIVARFRPDDEGWQDALLFADIKAQVSK